MKLYTTYNLQIRDLFVRQHAHLQEKQENHLYCELEGKAALRFSAPVGLCLRDINTLHRIMVNSFEERGT